MVTEIVTPRIAPLEPPFAPEVATQLQRMMPPGVPPIALGAQLVSLTFGSAQDECWPEERDRLLIQAVDSLHGQADISDDLWRLLCAAFSDANPLDLLLLCGWYHAVSFAARAARVPLEPGAPRFGSLRGN
jgi:hypothetical protein